MKRKCLIFGLMTAIVLFQQASYAALSGSDDFSFEDLTKWTILNNFDGLAGGQLSNVSGKAAYSSISSGGDDFAAYAWTVNTAPKTTSWEARIDVFLPQSDLAVDQYAGVGLVAFWPEPVPIDVPENLVEINIELDEGFRGFSVLKKTSAVDSDLAFSATSTSAGSLRLAWDANTALFSFYYDDNGGQDSWVLLHSTHINDWGMPDTGEFGVAVSAFSGNVSLTTANGLAIDNFFAVTPSVPEPSVLLLFGLGVIGVVRKKKL
ncbi:PEP-CTERM sorting domain-containing protein [bacterium]|nr:PEP-CTERM sorting domain-containing protein [bacterium]